MASWYSVIQYVPDPIAGERINIGVVVFDDGNLRVQFLKRWERVRCFGMENIEFLRSFARRMEAAAIRGELLPGDGEENSAWDTLTYLERTQKAARGWMNSIQFTEPRKSLDTVQGQLEDAVQTYLKEPARERRKLRDRQAAARLATSRIRGALKEQLGQRAVDELLRPQYSLTGRREEHQVDVAVANGQAYLVAHAISFEVQVTRQYIDSLAWMVSDVREAKPELPIAVVALKPVEGTFGYKDQQKQYSRTIEVYQGLGASVLDEAHVKIWAKDRLRGVNLWAFAD